jgi:hypothetical protein
MRTGGDITKLKVAFRNFAKAPKKGHAIHLKHSVNNTHLVPTSQWTHRTYITEK